MEKAIRSNNSGLLGGARLKLAEKLVPVKGTKILSFDKMNLDLKEAFINQINVPPIRSPEITNDFCPPKPQITRSKIVPSYAQIFICKNKECLTKLRLPFDHSSFGRRFRITCPVCHDSFEYIASKDELIGDFTSWLEEELNYPEIQSFPVILDQPKKAGKAYGRIEAEERQATLFDTEEGENTCVHGLRKSWCSTCIERERKGREKRSSHVDLFDLIFPILQPPLGENFDSPIAFPPGMELYPFQGAGVKFLAERERALLADEMGLGKSIQAITATRFLFRMGRITNGLILCPKSVLTDWEKKLWEWAPEIRNIKVRGSREQRQIMWNTPSHIYLTTYETLRQDLQATLQELSDKEPKTLSLFGDAEEPELEGELEDLAKREFDLVILDEIQKIKNPGAEVTKATRQIESPLRWGLSGTPLENRLEELISVFAYLKPGLLRYDDAARPRKVKEAIKPYFLRRRKKDALPDLPEKFYEEKWLELTSAQREAYDKAEREGRVALNERGDEVTVQHILALITKLKQICNIEPVSGESCKLEHLSEKLEEISEQGEKALVFSQYPDKTLRFLEPELERFKPLMYHGSLSEAQRESIIKTFQEEENNKVLLMSVKAGGLGITLTRANYVFHFDLWWNPSVAEQAEDRAHRIGQEKTVFANYLFTVDTIEEDIQNLLKRKRELFKNVIEDLGDKKLTNVLTEEELFGLFGLERRGRRAKAQAESKGPKTADFLSGISAIEFEEVIGRLYEKMGYQIRLTPQSRDQGIDIYAKRLSETGTEYLAIQCKHYPNGVVGVEHARALYGVVQAEPTVTRGVLITSGEFSRECKEFARDKRIELFDGTYVLGLLEKYKV